jgi:hypothetical protein
MIPLQDFEVPTYINARLTQKMGRMPGRDVEFTLCKTISELSHESRWIVPPIDSGLKPNLLFNGFPFRRFGTDRYRQGYSPCEWETPPYMSR